MFKPPLYQFNGHFQTIYPSLFRKINIETSRERITLPDGDFLLLDWVNQGSDKCVIVTHGLEGDSTRHYVTGALKVFADQGYDGLGWNSRSCGGEINLLPRFYHHGDASDLLYVIQYAQQKFNYKEIVLVGFSMGGSLTMRVVSEHKAELPNAVSSAIVSSVPLDLPSSVAELDKSGKRFYMNRFIKKLKRKIEIKEQMFPNHPILHLRDYDSIKNFEDFDNRFTAPLHGYENATDFYLKASVKPILSEIEVPSLIIQAKNDPFLTPECLDLGDASSNSNVSLMLTEQGGHVGFMQKGFKETFFEQEAIKFALKSI